MMITHENALEQVLYQNSVLPLATTLGGHLLLVTAIPHEKEKERCVGTTKTEAQQQNQTSILLDPCNSPSSSTTHS